MDAEITITDVSALDSFQAWARSRLLRGKSLEDSVQKIMRYWVVDAFYNIPAGDRRKVETYLKTQVAKYSSLSAQAARGPAASTKAGQATAARANALRGTVGARIVAALNIYHARRLKAPVFYAAVNIWIRRRIFSANLHRSGLIPARRLLRISDRSGPMPKIKNFPGSITSTFTDDLASITVENWASSHGGAGIAALAPNAFETALAQTDARIAAWVQEKLEASARSAGLDVR